jgi:hypothetical protein
MPKVYAEPKEDVMKDCLATGGTDDFHTMPDGWKLHSETFMPPGEPKAMIVHTPGWMESTVTVGVRRLAKQCSERGIVLVTYDMHGHGLSLEKNGVAWTTEAKRGKIEGVQGVIDTHLVEIVKIFLERHKLPLMLLGHSLGAQAAMLATRQVVELCRAAGVPYVTGAYLAPHVQATPPCCCGCCTPCCCGACCCGCGYCCKMGKHQAEEGKNPGGVLTGGKIEEDRNATSVLFYHMFSTGVCLPSSAGGTASWARYTPEIDVGVPGRVFVGDKDPSERAAADLLSIMAPTTFTHECTRVHTQTQSLKHPLRVRGSLNHGSAVSAR